jgi:quercetin dioxygenase-like cupin family protein
MRCGAGSLGFDAAAGKYGRVLTMKTSTLPPAEALSLHSLVTPTEQGIASRVLAKTSAGSVTLFACDAGQGLSEHSTPFDALVLVLDGEVTLTIGGTAIRATSGTITRMPANIPHAVDAVVASRLLLLMLRERPSA